MIEMPSPNRRNLLEKHEHLTPWRRGGYIYHPFTLPPLASRVGVILSFHKEKIAQMFISLHSPSGFRGNMMKPAAKGDVVLDLWVAPNAASEGGLPGDLEPGEWLAQINVERLGEETDYHLVVYADFDPVSSAEIVVYPENYVVNTQAGWYQGELHAHSTESDGKWPVRDVIQAVQDIGLDFFALTDHFTVSQWRKMAPLLNQRTALIRSSEITSHIGHANMHGIQRWVNVFVDQPGWSMNQAADDVHTQGGLFCINHPFSGDLCARDFDWHKADLMEVYHNLEGCNNITQISWWDHLLLTGHRLVGVGGTDSHHPYDGLHAMGKLLTWVYADSLSEKGILAGLQRGQVYISRGAEMRFTAANDQGETAEMWESLATHGKPAEFHLRCLSQDKMILFIYKDGLLFDNYPLNNEAGVWYDVHFNDLPHRRSYYRVELHREYTHPEYKGIFWRDQTTFLAASNPIFAE